MVWIFAGGVQNADAHGPVRVHVGMEDVALETHRWGGERIVMGKGERGGEDSTGVRRARGPGDKSFPKKEIRFGYGTCGYAVRGRGGEVFVFVKEALRGYGRGHLFFFSSIPCLFLFVCFFFL